MEERDTLFGRLFGMHLLLALGFEDTDALITHVQELRDKKMYLRTSATQLLILLKAKAPSKSDIKNVDEAWHYLALKGKLPKQVGAFLGDSMYNHPTLHPIFEAIPDNERLGIWKEVQSWFSSSVNKKFAAFQIFTLFSLRLSNRGLIVS